jgi:Subtilase family
MTTRILIKLAHPAGTAAAEPLAAAGGVTLQHLFDAPPPETPGMASATPSRHAWYLAEVPADSPFAAQTLHPWDATHALVHQELGLARDTQVVAAEPDIEQAWPPRPQQQGIAAETQLRRAGAPEAQKGSPYVPGPGFGWHLGDDFTTLQRARDDLKVAQSEITIVHLDTGYDRTHKARPANVAEDRERNFVDPGRTDRADDETPPSGFLTNRGHGTGTLGILAGRKLDGMEPVGEIVADGFTLGGAAPMRIVPVRIANSVVHFWTSTVAQGIDYARQIEADVISMSMGGLPSDAWADAVNAAYEAGIVVVCAGGNNFGGLPTSLIVYPARFQRVIAACGAMADRTPYFHLPVTAMEGNVGPDSKMRTAIAAFTPNIPWARIGAPSIIDLDGEGTSAATPQVAAAAALWLHRNGAKFPKNTWQRAEAARQALFRTAVTNGRGRPDPFFGSGLLQAGAALALGEPDRLNREPADSASLAFLHLVTGAFGVAAGSPSTRQNMLALELAQLALTSKTAQETIADPELTAGAPENRRRRFLEAIRSEGRGSTTLNRFLDQLLAGGGATPVQVVVSTPTVAPPVAPASASENRRLLPPPPPNRRLRIFAIDPESSRRLSTAFLNIAVAEIPWETAANGKDNLLQPGPVGEYLEVVDVDPASGAAYEPVDLNDPSLLAQDGLPPAEGNPQFHQQMVYAVAMQTIRHFESALGRRALFAPQRIRLDPLRSPSAGQTEQPPTAAGQASSAIREAYVQRLRIYPHALREANAYYSPDKIALLLGYFPAGDGSRRLVFTCLSHDIIAHETTHALLDGLHRRFQEATNPDVLAFHEAFADMVALFQHFTFPELLRHEIQRARGDLAHGDLLARLALEFGQALGRSEGLRSAITRPPSPADYESATEPHDRGSILVAAVFDAFLAIYNRRAEDLMRIASGGSGVLAPGALHPDLVARLAEEATRAAKDVLIICIRALDYMPPVDPMFPEYLRALITADSDLVANDRYGYRVAFLEAFGKRGIFPKELRTLSVDSLRWQTLAPAAQPPDLQEFLVNEINISWDIAGSRFDAYISAHVNAAKLHDWLAEHLSPQTARALGLDRDLAIPGQPDAFAGRRDSSGRPRFEVHSVRPARRTSPEGDVRTDIIAVITQWREVPDGAGGTFRFRGGCTLVLDRSEPARPIRYSISKPIYSESDQERVRNFRKAGLELGLNSLYFADGYQTEPFAMLHSQM